MLNAVKKFNKSIKDYLCKRNSEQLHQYWTKHCKRYCWQHWYYHFNNRKLRTWELLTGSIIVLAVFISGLPSIDMITSSAFGTRFVTAPVW